jgi:aminoglycoside 6-adenylyltransferase
MDLEIEHLIAWGESQPLVRAMILTSTRAVTGLGSDLFSDYDVILGLTDVRPFFESRDWLAAFGRVLVMYQDPLEEFEGFPKSGNVVQFDGALKIDFSLWSVGILQKVVAGTIQNPELDAGYRVLLDKDSLTRDLKPPTYRAYIPTPPTETEYREGVEDFLLVAIYIAKYLWRGDLIAVKHLHGLSCFRSTCARCWNGRSRSNTAGGSNQGYTAGGCSTG